MNRCSKCILPTAFPGVELNDSGKCNYCTNFEKKYSKLDQGHDAKLKNSLKKILDESREKGKYDCLVPLSGGKDSAYVLYVIATVYDMNVLAFNMNNGFQSSIARKNIETAVNKVGCDLITYTPSERNLNRLFRTFLVQAGELCSPCNNLIRSTSESIARQHDIPLVVKGGGGRWSASIAGASISKYSNYSYYKKVINKEIALNEIKKYMPKSNMKHFKDRLLRKKPRVIQLFDFYNLSKESMLDTIKEHLGWNPPSEELEHGDCLLNPLKDYLVCKKWGFSEITGGYGTLVRNGKMGREEAIEKAETEEVRVPPKVLDKFLRKIGMTENDFEEALNRHFTDIPNDAGMFYNFIKKAYHFVR